MTHFFFFFFFFTFSLSHCRWGPQGSRWCRLRPTAWHSCGGLRCCECTLHTANLPSLLLSLCSSFTLSHDVTSRDEFSNYCGGVSTPLRSTIVLPQSTHGYGSRLQPTVRFSMVSLLLPGEVVATVECYQFQVVGATPISLDGSETHLAWPPTSQWLGRTCTSLTDVNCTQTSVSVPIPTAEACSRAFPSTDCCWVFTHPTVLP
jgi:hypothetical protein